MKEWDGNTWSLGRSASRGPLGFSTGAPCCAIGITRRLGDNIILKFTSKKWKVLPGIWGKCRASTFPNAQSAESKKARSWSWIAGVFGHPNRPMRIGMDRYTRSLMKKKWDPLPPLLEYNPNTLEMRGGFLGNNPPYFFLMAFSWEEGVQVNNMAKIKMVEYLRTAEYLPKYF